MKQAWQKQSRRMRNDATHQQAYITQLLQQNVFQEVEQALVSFQRKQPVVDYFQSSQQRN